MQTEILLCLENLKPGDEITTITRKGCRLEYGPIRVITERDDRFKRWRYSRPGAPHKNIGVVPDNGEGFMFMQRRDSPPAFYYSANPEHIRKAKIRAKRIRAKTEKTAAEKARRMALAHPIGELLKTEYYDREENYRLDSANDIAETIIGLLSDTQISTLKEWLNLKTEK